MIDLGTRRRRAVHKCPPIRIKHANKDRLITLRRSCALPHLTANQAIYKLVVIIPQMHEENNKFHKAYVALQETVPLRVTIGLASKARLGKWIAIWRFASILAFVRRTSLVFSEFSVGRSDRESEKMRQTIGLSLR